MADIGLVEYRVKKITRYQITRHWESAERTTGATEQRGEYDNGEVAFEVAYALCKAEHERLGFPPGDDRIQYPKRSVAFAQIGGEAGDVSAEGEAMLQATRLRQLASGFLGSNLGRE